VLDLDTDRVRPLIADSANNSEPNWSPDGSKLTFTSDRDGNKEIYVAQWDGSQITRLTSKPGIDDHPTFSPDGKSILYDSQEPGSSDVNLRIVSISGGKDTVVTSLSGRNSFGRWAPNGESLVFVTDRHWPGSDLCLWNLKQSSESCLFQGTDSYYRPTYSSSGKIIVYSGGSVEQVDLYLMDLRSREAQKITSRVGRELDPAFSPDDKLVAFCGELEKTGMYNIFLLTSEKTIVPLLQSQKYSMRTISWTKARTLELEVARLKRAQD
jgi:TolB protein